MVLLSASMGAWAAYPDRPLTLIVPFAAGGPTDVMARVVAESLTKVMGQPVIVENTPGAGGTVGGTRASRAVCGGGHRRSNTSTKNSRRGARPSGQ